MEGTLTVRVLEDTGKEIGGTSSFIAKKFAGLGMIRQRNWCWANQRT